MNNQKITLWEIGSEYQKLLPQLFDQETGEINELVEQKLNQISGSAEEKCKAVANWIKSIEHEKKQIEMMKEEILRREKAYDHEIEQKLLYLKINMERCEIKEIKCPYFTVKIKTNPYSTEILNEGEIPEKFMRTREIVKTEIKPDKNAIKEEVLRTGEQIAGAYVSQKTKLEINIDKI